MGTGPRAYNGAVCAPSVTLEQSWAGWHLGSGQEFISLERASPPPPRLHRPIGVRSRHHPLPREPAGQQDGDMPTVGTGEWALLSLLRDRPAHLGGVWEPLCNWALAFAKGR